MKRFITTLLGVCLIGILFAPTVKAASVSIGHNVKDYVVSYGRITTECSDSTGFSRAGARCIAANRAVYVETEIIPSGEKYSVTSYGPTDTYSYHKYVVVYGSLAHRHSSNTFLIS